jgi:hypothetical protein
LVICFALVAGSFVNADDKTTIRADKIAEIQDLSVTIHAGNAQGSGEIKTRNGVNFVWTAGHVVEGLRTTREVIDSKTGTHKTVIEFRDAKVVKELIEDGRSVGRLEMDAEVIRYSNVDNGEDLAVLRIRKRNFVKSSLQFYLEEQIPPVGTTLYHCGSLLGQVGSNSFTRGIMSQHGRVVSGKVYDQTTCAAFPGSSGGGVYLPDGRMCGMIVRGAGETFNLIVPVRRIHEWAKKAGVEFALDDKVPVPSDAELRKMPVEENGTRLDSPEKVPAPAPSRFPFLIGSLFDDTFGVERHAVFSKMQKVR